jgi:hypothetical protein
MLYHVFMAVLRGAMDDVNAYCPDGIGATMR